MSNPDIRKDVKVLFLRIQILSQNSNSFHRISIFLDLSLRIKFQNSILKIFQTLSSNIFDLNLWVNVQNFYFWEVQNYDLKFKFIWIHPNSASKIPKVIFLLFSSLIGLLARPFLEAHLCFLFLFFFLNLAPAQLRPTQPRTTRLIFLDLQT
jgi:hypothetical protein